MPNDKKTQFVLSAVAAVVIGTSMALNAYDVNQREATRNELNAQRERANKPWAILQGIPGWDEGPMCWEFAINYAYRLNNETDVKAWVVLMHGFDYSKPPREGMFAHAMVYFVTPDNRFFVADQNRPYPTEFNWSKVQGLHDEQIATAAFQQHLSDSKTANPLACSIFGVAHEYGKQDVFNDFSRHGNSQMQEMGHVYYFPKDYARD